MNNKITTPVKLPERKSLDEILFNYNSGNLILAEKLAFHLTKKFPQHSFSYKVLAAILQKNDRLDEAYSIINQALLLSPHDAELHNNLGCILNKQGKFLEAKVSFEEAIKLKPDLAVAHNNLGNAQNNLGLNNGAIISYQTALSLNSNYSDALNNLANLLVKLGKFTEAELAFKNAIRINPKMAEAHYNKSLLDLLRGNFQNGFQGYEWRKKTSHPLGNRLYPVTSWLGDKDLKDKTILIHWEQGLGDTIQMCRYLKILVDEGACVLFAPQRQLQKLLSTLDERIKIVDIDDPHLKFDYHCPVMSLPLAFKTTLETIPKCVPYLSAEENRIAKWRERIGTDGFKIGICWSGSAIGARLGRSFPLDIFYPISQIDGVRLISIHKGDGEIELKNLPNGMKVEVLGAEFDCGEQAFLDTAAVMKCCDLVITSDTAITHLAGAMSIPTWIAHKYTPHWFWMLERSDSPWYPTLKLFRQKELDNWDEVFEEIHSTLLDLLSRK